MSGTFFSLSGRIRQNAVTPSAEVCRSNHTGWRHDGGATCCFRHKNPVYSVYPCSVWCVYSLKSKRRLGALER